MNGLLQQLRITLQLYFRNTMALVYGYLFPTIFLVAFWVLYRYDKVPLARHMGELLTISVLGGACFGLPTSMVSERERGVWRRYRLAPLPTGYLVASTVIARYLILITAGVLQIALAMAIGMPFPRHPVDLFLAFTLVAFAFLGLGLVIATLADNVPAVQALGQCLFLPMLIIGGIAVPLASLPDWAQHVSAFFPGRYAVEAVQASVTGNGLGTARFSLIALLLIGAAACVAGAKLFRWDAQQRFVTLRGKAWIGVALMAWIAVGLVAESRGDVAVLKTAAPDAVPATATTVSPPPTLSLSPAEQAALRGALPSPLGSAQPPAPAPLSSPASSPPATLPVTPPAGTPSTPAPAPTTSTPPPPAQAGVVATPGPKTWQAVTLADIDRDFIFTRLPPDDSVVTPIAPPDEVPSDDVLADLEGIRVALPTWKPGKVEDPVQRTRNFLYVAAVPDIFQTPMERYVPQIVFDHLLQEIPKDDLIKILYWIGVHPTEGADRAVDELRPLGLGNGPSDVEQLRERTAVYAVKLLGRITGRRPAR